MTTRRLDWSSDAGVVGGAEVLPFGVLIFVVGALLVTNLWGVIDVKMATDAAAREGARAIAESPSGAGPATIGRPEAEAALSAHGHDGTRIAYTVDYPSGWAPCADATVTVSYDLTLIALPMIDLAGPAVTIASSHSEIIDPYRSRDVDPGALSC